MRERGWARRFGVVAITAAAAAAGCGSGSSGGDLGRMQLALALPGPVAISSVSYSVQTSAGGVVAFDTLEVTAGETSVSLNVGLPAGSGYLVSLTARSSAGDVC